MIISTFSSVCIPLRSAALYGGFQIKILRILIKTAMAAMIMQNFHHSSQSRATTSRSTQQHCNNTTAMAATIMQNSHESHQTRATDYGNGRNDCAESSHDGKTRATGGALEPRPPPVAVFPRLKAGQGRDRSTTPPPQKENTHQLTRIPHAETLNAHQPTQ